MAPPNNWRKSLIISIDPKIKIRKAQWTLRMCPPCFHRGTPRQKQWGYYELCSCTLLVTFVVPLLGTLLGTMNFVTFVLCKTNFGSRYTRFVYNFLFSLHSFCLICVLIFVISFHVKKNSWLSLHPFCEAKSLHSFRNLADFREIRLWESALGYICILLQRSRVRACSHLARRSGPRIIKVMDLSGPRIIEGNHPESAPRIIKGKQLGDPRII